MFQLAALYAILRARRGDSGPWLPAAAYFVGLSLGVKHTAVFVSFPLGLLILWQLRRQPRPWRLTAIMAVVFAASGLFWHARTYALTGNPFFPAEADRSVRTVPAMDGTRPSRATVHLTYPWHMHFNGDMVMEGPTRSPAGFFFLIFAPWWALLRRRRASPGERAVLFVLLIFYLYWAYVWGVAVRHRSGAVAGRAHADRWSPGPRPSAAPCADRGRADVLRPSRCCRR